MVSQHQVAKHSSLPRILIVTRRTLRKNKYVDFVGEYHLSLLLENNAIPILLPRVPPTSSFLEAYQPFDGLLLVEGEDISPSFRPSSTSTLSSASLAAIAAAHPADARPDHEKDSIEFSLVHHALAHSIPILAICRGSQILNVAAGGDILPDIDVVLARNVRHIDYVNYDNHRHPIRTVPSTPLHCWFDGALSINVNSYHHQAISRLASRFVPMAHAPDGVIEAYYDPHCYNPSQAKFIVGLQFHPERMQSSSTALADKPPVFDYPGCPKPYQQFVMAATTFRRNRLMGLHSHVPDAYLNPSSTDHRSTHRDPSQVEIFRKPLSSSVALSNRYSKEDLDRIMRSGGTVHGSSLVLRMLQKENISNYLTPSNQNIDLTSTHDRSEWKRFRRGVEQAERALHGLRDKRKIEEAFSLLEKLSEICSSIMPDTLARASLKRLDTKT